MPGAHVGRFWVGCGGMPDATPIPDRRSNSPSASRRWLAAWKLVRKLPEPAAFGLGRVGGRVYLHLDRDRRGALTANLAQVLGPVTGRRELELAGPALHRGDQLAAGAPDLVERVTAGGPGRRGGR